MSLTRKLQPSGFCVSGGGGQHLEREPDRLSAGSWRWEDVPFGVLTGGAWCAQGFRQGSWGKLLPWKHMRARGRQCF